MTTIKDWEKKVLSAPGAAERVESIEEQLRLTAGLTALRERSGLSQRELAERIGVRQPRIAAIERSRNVTLEVLERYVSALGGRLELSVIQSGKKTALLGARRDPFPANVKAATRSPRKSGTTATSGTSRKPAPKTAAAKRSATTKSAAVARTTRKKSA